MSTMALSRPIKKSPRQRTFLTNEIKESLEIFYVREPYPSPQRMSEIADEITGVTAENVKLWFQNRRAKERQENPDSKLRRCRRRSPSDPTDYTDDGCSPDYYEMSSSTSSSSSSSCSSSESTTPTAQTECIQLNSTTLTPFSLTEEPVHFDNVSMLVLSARGGNSELIQLLLQTGVEVNSLDSLSGTTALIEAVAAGHSQIVADLLASGASAEFGDTFGRRPLHVACQFNHHEIVSMLISRGAAIESTDNGGFTPLQVAVAMGSVECISILAISGANTLVVTSDCQTLSDLAKLNSNTQIICDLLQLYSATNFFL